MKDYEGIFADFLPWTTFLSHRQTLRFCLHSPSWGSFRNYWYFVDLVSQMRWPTEPADFWDFSVHFVTQNVTARRPLNLRPAAILAVVDYMGGRESAGRRGTHDMSATPPQTRCLFPRNTWYSVSCSQSRWVCRCGRPGTRWQAPQSV